MSGTILRRRDRTARPPRVEHYSSAVNTTRFLPACGYELRLVHHEPESHRTISRYYTRAQLLGSVRYLRGMNREGYHVFFRPAAPHFVYVDDVSDDDIDAMLADGLRPVLVYQTSEGLRHAWFQLANRPEYVTEVEATMARKILAERYRGDRCATGKNQLGRLPGLRNVKPMHEDRDGGHPLVIIKRGVFAPVASTLLAEAKDRVAASPQLSPLPPRGRVFPCALNTDIDPSRSPMTPEEAHNIYEAELRHQAERNGWSLPAQKGVRSHADYAVVYGLRVQYGYDPDDLAALLLHASDKAAERGMDYVIRTVHAAL